MLFLVLEPFTFCPHSPLQFDQVGLDLRLTSLRRAVLYHVGSDGDLGLVETPPAQVDRADFQGALAAVHGRLEQLASDPDLAVAPAFV